MFVIIGLVIVLACVLGSFVAMGGKLGVLWQPFEFVIILGAAIGAFVIDTLLRGQQKAVGFVPAMHVVGRQQLVEELNAHGVLGDPVDLIG